MKITKSYRKMADVYKLFAKSFGNLDFSEKALQVMFEFESRGNGKIEIDCFSATNNGYAVGKKWLNVMVSMWKEDIKSGLFNKKELYKDFPKWWLDKILK